MKKVAVIYKSKYGTTKQYAVWIAEALGADLIEKSSINPEKLVSYDIVVYGGGIYASGILGIDLIAKKPCKRLIIFTVGLANPNTTDYTEIINKNLPIELRSKVKVFHLRGGIDYKKLNVLDRSLMAMRKKMTVDKKTPNELSDEELSFVESYGNQVNFTDQKTIQPIVDYICKI